MARFPTRSGTTTERRIADPYAVIDIGGVGPILEEKRIVAITVTALFEMDGPTGSKMRLLGYWAEVLEASVAQISGTLV